MSHAPLSAVAIDLTRIHRRTVTSFYSNLVTRPTGRAVRAAVEQQLMEVAGDGPCLSILDFSQVRVMDYSCADEIVAKLLLKYSGRERPTDAYFLARGLASHHLDSVSAVLDRHGLLLASLDGQESTPALLGPCSPLEHRCWTHLARQGRARIEEVANSHGLTTMGITAIVERLVAGRVVVPLGNETLCALPALGDPSPGRDSPRPRSNRARPP